MKSLLFLISIISATALVTPTEARTLPWCAHYGNGGRNCGFVSYEQCRATIKGMGGSCRKNPRVRI